MKRRIIFVLLISLLVSNVIVLYCLVQKTNILDNSLYVNVSNIFENISHISDKQKLTAISEDIHYLADELEIFHALKPDKSLILDDVVYTYKIFINKREMLPEGVIDEVSNELINYLRHYDKYVMGNEISYRFLCDVDSELHESKKQLDEIRMEIYKHCN